MRHPNSHEATRIRQPAAAAVGLLPRPGAGGFTFIELALAMFVILGALAMNLQSLLAFSGGNALLAHRYLAQADANRVVEDLRRGAFGDKPPFSGLVITGLVNTPTYRKMDVDNASVLGEAIQVHVKNGTQGSSRLDTVTVSVSWKEANGRVVGQDGNLDGLVTPPGEDPDGNGVLDSPAQLVTLITALGS